MAAPLIVKAIPAEKSQEEATRDAKDKADKAFYDFLTAFVAAGTLVVLIVQTFVFGWQAHRLKQTIDTMRQVASDQAKDTRDAINASKESIDVARQNLLSTHRPRVRARRFYLEEVKENEPIVIRFDYGQYWRKSGKDCNAPL